MSFAPDRALETRLPAVTMLLPTSRAASSVRLRSSRAIGWSPCAAERLGQHGPDQVGPQRHRGGGQVQGDRDEHVGQRVGVAGQHALVGEAGHADPGGGQVVGEASSPSLSLTSSRIGPSPKTSARFCWCASSATP